MRILVLLISFVFLTGFGENFKNFSLPPHQPKQEPIRKQKPPQTRPKQEMIPISVSTKNLEPSTLGTGATETQVLSALPSQFNCNPKNNPLANEIMCHVCNCFHEGRGEYSEGRVNIQRVVYTRMLSEHYPNTACEVIYQRSQFSWTLSSSKVNQVLGMGVPGAEGFKGCVQSVGRALQYKGKWFASHYHTTSVRPYWASTCRGAKTFGAHIMYTGGCGAVRPRTNYDNYSPDDAVSMIEKTEYKNEI